MLTCVFLDNVKNRSILTLIQCVGRVLRSEENKKYGLVIDGYNRNNINDHGKMMISNMIKYYDSINNIFFGDKNNDDTKHHNKLNIVNDDGSDIILVNNESIDIYYNDTSIY